jgi:hypothetical protein
MFIPGDYLQGELILSPERGFAFDTTPIDWKHYDQAYFDKYAGYERDPMTAPLNTFRRDFVKRSGNGRPIIDIGIGAGTFLRDFAPHGSYGFDVNPAGIAWLESRGLFIDINSEDVCWSFFDGLTFWDSLEHIHNPTTVLSQLSAEQQVWLSIPIVEAIDPQVIKISKHYRPGRHVWYFTQEGVIEFFRAAGFGIIEQADDETRIGRDSVLSFCFQKTGPLVFDYDEDFEVDELESLPS